MKFYTIPLKHLHNKQLALSQLSGNLLETEFDASHQTSVKNYPTKLIKALKICKSPYSEKLPGEGISKLWEEEQSNIKNSILARTISLTRFNFFIARKYASIETPLFNSSSEAALYFRSFNTQKQNELCLSRSLFMAKTSKEFKRNGVIFVGVFMPTRSMHAWVIENEKQADLEDSYWINFQPVAALA